MLSVHDTPGVITIDAIRPLLTRWTRRGFGNLSFHLTQLLSGHGCFGHYLWRMQKRPTAACQHCGAADDTVGHSLRDCPAWANQRTELARGLGLARDDDLTLYVILERALVSPALWGHLQRFAIAVVGGKEKEERRRARSRTPSPHGSISS